MILRDYQIRDLEKLRAEYRAGRRAPIYQGATGSGKTVLFSHIVKGAAAKGSNIWIVVHRQELLDQCSLALTELGIRHGLVAAGRHPPPTQVLVCSAQTLVRRLYPDKMGPVHLIVLDEAHHAAAGTWRKIIAARPNARLLGVTATPQRLDGKGLGVSSGGVFDSLVNGPPAASLIEAGHLSDYTAYSLPSALDMTGARKTAGDWNKRDIAERVAKAMITGDAVKHYRRICPGAPAIAFCPSVAHAAATAEAFRADGWRSESIDGTLSGPVRQRRIEALGNGGLHVLTSCEIVSEGTDIPVVTAAILLRPTQSMGLYLQQVGRCMRPAPGKEQAIILDHVGNVLRHGFPDDERVWSLDGAPQGRDAEPVPDIRVCGFCCASFRPAPACPICGTPYVLKVREIRQEAGELQKIEASDKERIRMERKGELRRARTREELIEYARKRNFGGGDAVKQRSYADHVLRGRAQATARWKGKTDEQIRKFHSLG